MDFELFDIVAITAYLFSIFIFTYFVRPIIDKVGKKTEWREKVFPVIFSWIIGGGFFWSIKKFSTKEISLENILIFLFLSLMSSKIYEKSEVIWKLLTDKFGWLKDKRPGKSSDE